MSLWDLEFGTLPPVVAFGSVRGLEPSTGREEPLDEDQTLGDIHAQRS